jgi:SHS2 domain-containing protein
MKKYEILEHKADLKIRAFGKDLEELFLNTMIGMFESAKYEPAFAEATAGKEIKKEIKVSSLDLPSLLVDFLSEVLYLSEVNKEVYNRIGFKKFSDKRIEGILLGKKLKRIGVVIKGVTYHDLEIKQNKDGGWEATILFDI